MSLLSCRTRVVLAALSLLLCVAPAFAQSAYYFPDAKAADFDPAVPTPEQFLGYPIGEHYTRHDRLVDYFNALARISDKVRVQELGRSYEQRPQIGVIITSAANLARLPQIEAARATVVDPSAPALDPATQPVTVGLFYSVHGNETSSGEAAMLTAYYLVAHRGEETRQWLERAVMVINPAQNPDGRDRAANWHNAWWNNPPVADPLDKEHVEPFPMGRTNHYFTDLNRDWLAITQRETRDKLVFFHRWYPNVQIDFHEMGTSSTYYFEPSPTSMESPLLPRESYAANVTLGRYHAAALDRLGSLYFTREVYDNFSPVYGSTYPDFHGGVGVTVEQGSSRGRVQESDGGEVTFPFTIRNQTSIGLATVRGAVGMHAELFNLQRLFYRTALEQGRKHSAAGFVFGDPDNRTLTWKLLDLLLQHRIQVAPLQEAVTLDGKRFEPGSAFVVPSAQPQFRLVHSIFDLTPPINEAVYGSTSYAIAAAYGLRHARSGRLPARGANLLQLPPAADGGVAGDGGYAYLIDWREHGATRVLQQLWTRGIKVRAAFQPFTSDTTQGRHGFGHGTLVIPVAGQALDAAALRTAIDGISREAGVQAWAVATGQVVDGVDLGSNSVKPLLAPKVALVMGQGVIPTEIGSTWFVLSEHVQLAPTRLDPSQLAKADLSRYTSIVLGGGQYGDLGDATVEALRRYVQAGGSLVTLGTASRWAVEKKLIAAGKDEAKSPDDAKAARADFGRASEVRMEQRTAGNMLTADVDITHPLAFGVPTRALWVFKETDVTLPVAADPFSTVVRIDDKPVVNGYLSDQVRNRFVGQPWATVNALGAGTVVAFADDPAHRKYWHGTERLLLNALLLSKHLRAPGPRG